MLRQGHLEEVLQVMSYLKFKHNFTQAFYPSYLNIYQSNFGEGDCTNFYKDAVEHISPNTPLPKGKEMDLHMLIDSNHAGSKQTRRYRTEFMMHMNMSLINWYSKKESAVETLVFGADFVAMKVGVDALHNIQYKLRMMGILVSGPTYIYGITCQSS